jgi:hypothetical protein
MAREATIELDSGPIKDPLSTADQKGPDGPSLPCLYCRGEIQAQSFLYWSSAKRLLSAICPTCRRRVTLAASSWRRAQTSGPEVSWLRP